MGIPILAGRDFEEKDFKSPVRTAAVNETFAKKYFKDGNALGYHFVLLDSMQIVGGDLKYSLTPSLTLDATFNTDFAQVEVDEQQINLDRFNLFFPEKRPFFLENAGLFSVGNPGEAEIFFSRRIGIGPDGGEIPILGGARVSGRIAGTSIGFLNMQTESAGGVTAANNFTVGRVQRELPNRSAVGVMFTNRQGTGDLAPANDYNRAVALDARVGYGRNGQRLDLTAKEFALLAALARRKGEILSKTTIAELVWDVNFDSDTNVVEVAIKRLRAKLDGPFQSTLLHTVRGMGYVLEVRDQDQGA